MASFAGLISGVLGGAAAGYGESAQMEMKKQADLDLRKQMLEAESEKRLREDETRRERDRAAEDRKLSPEYIAKVNAADLTKATGAIVNRTTLAPLAAGADVAEGTAKAGARTTLAPINADAEKVEGASKLGTQIALAPAQAAAARVQFDAEKELRGLKVNEATADQIAKAKALVADKGYMDALEKTDLAAHAHLIKIANIRAASLEDTSADRLEAARLKREAEANKPSKGPGGSANVGLELERAEKSAEKALARALGVEVKEANGAYIVLKRRADGGDAAAKAKLAEVTPMKNRLEAASAEWEARKKATGAAPAAAAPGGPVAASGARPPLSTFGSK